MDARDGRLSEHAAHVLPRTCDGAAAAVLVSREEGARARLRSVAVACRPRSCTSRSVAASATSRMPDVNTLHAQRRQRRPTRWPASVPSDLDLVELHDCFATAEILHYENLGLCKDGEAGRMIDEGETTHGGRVPVNVSGRPALEGPPARRDRRRRTSTRSSTHLRGEAGERQVPKAQGRPRARDRPRLRLHDQRPVGVAA